LQGLPWPFVELTRHFVEMRLRMLVANKAAHQTAFDAVIAARRALEKTIAAIEEAKVNAARHLTDVALGRDGAAPMSVKDARARVQDAEDVLEAAVSARHQLEKQKPEVESELRWAADKVAKCVRNVMHSEAGDIIDRTLRCKNSWERSDSSCRFCGMHVSKRGRRTIN
jgi:hypothetical protein